MGKFIVSRRLNGEYQFRLLAGNGVVILVSEGYFNRASCHNGIDSVRQNSIDDNKYDRLESKNGNYYFNLKASNGQIIGTSAIYASEAGRENGIQSVKMNAPSAVLEEG